MPEEKSISLYQQQKATKPKIEDVIPEHLNGDMKKYAFDLVGFLRENKIKPSWTLTNQWKAVCKGRNICRITLCPWNPPGKNRKWVVTAYLENLNKYENTIVSESLQNLLWDNVFYCCNKPKNSFPPEEQRNYIGVPPCNLWGCAPGKDITVCRKELTNICRNGNRQYFWFFDPDEFAINGIKRMLELEKQARTNL